MIKALIFDLDGTLIDSLPDSAAAANHALTQHGYPIHKLEAFKEMIGDGTKTLLLRALPVSSQSSAEVELLLPVYLAYYNKHYMWTPPSLPTILCCAVRI